MKMRPNPREANYKQKVHMYQQSPGLALKTDPVGGSQQASQNQRGKDARSRPIFHGDFPRQHCLQHRGIIAIGTCVGVAFAHATRVGRHRRGNFLDEVGLDHR